MFGRSLRVPQLAAAVFVLAAASVCQAADPEPKTRLPIGSANTIVAIRLKSINGAIKSFTDIVTAFEPKMAPMIDVQVAQGLKKFPGVDRDKPFAILILDPEKFDDPIVGVLPLADPKAFGEGVQDVPVAVIGKLGVIGDHEAARTEVMEYLKTNGIKAVPAADMTSFAVASADAGALMTRYKKQIQAGLQMLRMKATGKAPAGENEADIEIDGEKEPADEAAPALDPKKREMAIRGIDHTLKLIEHIEKQGGLVELGLSGSRSVITAKITADAIPGTPFAEFLSKNNLPANRALAKLLPKDAVTSSITTFDPASFSEAGLGMVSVACNIFGLGDDETKAINKVLADALANATGLSAQAEVPVKDGVSVVALQGIKDKDVARKSTQAIIALSKQGAIGDFLKKYGVLATLAVKHREHLGIPIDKMEITVDFDTLAAALSIDPGGREKMRKQMEDTFLATYGHKNKIAVEVAYGKRLSATTYGLEYAATMNKQIELMKAGGAGSLATVAEYQAALNRYPADISAFWHLSLFGKAEAIGKMMTQRMGPMMGGMDIFPKRSELPAEEEPISGAATVKADRILIEMRIPVKPVQAFAAVVQRKIAEQMKKKMEEMQEKGKPAVEDPFEEF